MIHWVIFFVLTTGFVFDSDTASAKPSQNRVEIEWEEMLGATKYQVEIELTKEQKSQLYDSPSNVFNLPIQPGIYQIRGRVADERGIFGEWSLKQKLEVLPPPPQFKKLSDSEKQKNSVVIDNKKFTAQVPLQWQPAEGVQKYELEIIDLNGKIIQTLATSQANIRLQLRPGTYRTKIRSITQDGLRSDPIEWPELLQVNKIPVPSPADLKRDVKTNTWSWTPQEGLSTNFKLERQKFLGTKWMLVELSESPKGQWSPQELQPGFYRLSIFNRNQFSESSALVSEEFVIKPKEENLP